MFGRDHDVADARALEARRFDQARGVAALRIGESRTTAPLADGLAFLAARDHVAQRVVREPGPWLELEHGAEEEFARHRRHDAPVGKRVLARLAAPLATARVADVDGAHAWPGLAAESAGVHAERAPERAGNAGEEFRRTQLQRDAAARDPRARYAGIGVQMRRVDALELVQ